MSIANYLTVLDEQRDALARNLVAMGVAASESEKLNTLVPKVLQIPQTKPNVTLFKASIDTLHDFGENPIANGTASTPAISLSKISSSACNAMLKFHNRHTAKQRNSAQISAANCGGQRIPP